MIEVKNISKTLKGNQVLKDISYTFDSGKIYGIYGYNGCGKTMFLRSIAGLLVLDKGQVIIDGKELHKDVSFPDSTGIVIEHMELLPNYTAFENLEILSKIRRIASKNDIKAALENVGLKPDSRQKVKKFSLGMKQRLNIAQAIFEGQKILLLDEPTNAIDEKGIELIYNLLRSLKEQGATIIIASHHKEDLNELCDVTIKIEKGMIVNE